MKSKVSKPPSAYHPGESFIVGTLYTDGARVILCTQLGADCAKTKLDGDARYGTGICLYDVVGSSSKYIGGSYYMGARSNVWEYNGEVTVSN